MTETDTTDIRTRSQYQTRDNESLPRTAEERRWIHVDLRSSVACKWPTNKPGSSGRTGCCSLRDTPRSRNKRAR